MKPQNEAGTFFQELGSSIKDIMSSLPGEIERAQKFLNGSDGQLAVTVSLTKARSTLEQFVKTAADKWTEHKITLLVINETRESSAT